MRKKFSFLKTLMAANIKNSGESFKKSALLGFFMFFQNAMFFTIWVILFDTVPSLKGWQLSDVANMFGVAAVSIGLSLYFMNGSRHITYLIQDGGIDAFLTRPRRPLPMILMSSSNPSNMGDILFGITIWLVFGNVGWQEAFLFFFLSMTSAIIFTSACVIIYSLSFWLKGSARFPEQLFVSLLIISTVIQHGQPLFIQVLMYTIFPAAYIAYLPAELLGQFNWGEMALILSMTALFPAMAVIVFNRGLKRYKNAQV